MMKKRREQQEQTHREGGGSSQKKGRGRGLSVSDRGKLSTAARRPLTPDSHSAELPNAAPHKGAGTALPGPVLGVKKERSHISARVASTRRKG